MKSTGAININKTAKVKDLEDYTNLQAEVRIGKKYAVLIHGYVTYNGCCERFAHFADESVYNMTGQDILNTLEMLARN